MINQKKLIDNLSVKIKAGNVVSIVGPNGSGKSTLVKLISKEISPSKGEIFFQGKNNNDWDAIDLALNRSVLAQSSHLSFSFSVIDIIRMGFYPNELLGSNQNTHLINKLLKVFDLDGYSDRIYTTLSGGEKQRVQLARVIAQIWSEENLEGKLLILDEPTSYLDIKHQLSLFKFLKKMNEKGLTIITVLHDLNHAIMISDKIMLLKAAKLINYGTVSDVVNSDVLKNVFGVELSIINDRHNRLLVTF